MSEEEKLKKSQSDYEKFINVAGSNLDEVTMILRTHMLVEYYLEQLIITSLPRGDELISSSRFNFYQKVIIVDSLGVLREDHINSIKKLNIARNNSAHSLDYKVTESEVEKIGRPFGDIFVKLKKEHFQTIKHLLHWTLGWIVAGLQMQLEFEVNKRNSSFEKLN